MTTIQIGIGGGGRVLGLSLCPIAVLRCAGVELFSLSIIKNVCTYVLVVGGLGAWRLHDVMWRWGVAAMLELVFTIDFIFFTCTTFWK